MTVNHEVSVTQRAVGDGGVGEGRVLKFQSEHRLTIHHIPVTLCRSQ